MRGLLLALGLLLGLSSAEVPESCYSHIDVREERRPIILDEKHFSNKLIDKEYFLS